MSTKEKKSKKEKVEKAPKVEKMKNEKVQIISDPADFHEIHEEISKIENAYMNAINGEIKFGEVKSMFKKLHKEIKKNKKTSLIKC